MLVGLAVLAQVWGLSSARTIPLSATITLGSTNTQIHKHTQTLSQEHCHTEALKYKDTTECTRCKCEVSFHDSPCHPESLWAPLIHKQKHQQVHTFEASTVLAQFCQPAQIQEINSNTHQHRKALTKKGTRRHKCTDQV